eukprot:scaffold99955_cov46-Cyclotella_meneghiniana.AAC.1
MTEEIGAEKMQRTSTLVHFMFEGIEPYLDEKRFDTATTLSILPSLRTSDMKRAYSSQAY